MKTDHYKINIVGAGIFGVTSALELAQRGHEVHLFDPGPLPHPDAASTDISKVLRMDYGKDEFYFDLMLAAFDGWDEWNRTFPLPLFHQTGFLMLSRDNWQPGGFEYDSYQELNKRNLLTTRLTALDLAQNYPAWQSDRYPQGYFNPRAGWAESGEVVRVLIQQCLQAGVHLHESNTFAELVTADNTVTGFRTTDGKQYLSDYVIIAAGSWTPTLLPDLQDLMWTTGHPVIHFKPANPSDYQPPHFPVWNADIANTGWYGFPVNAEGILKIANHGIGYRVDPREPRIFPEQEEARFREFLAESIPSLANAQKVGDRLCLYCDTWDGDFYIDHDPNRPGLLLTTGGSGHGFKFAPMLGSITADVLEGKPNRFAHRFAWRARGTVTKEDARHQ